MVYTVQSLARLSGISPRTLRFYDQIGLLCPGRVSSSGYRIYGAKEVELLQQILLYRRLEMPLEDIRAILYAPGFDPCAALRAHRQALLSRRMQLDSLLQNVEASIQSIEGGIPMEDAQRFEGMKAEMVAQNEEKYGKEVRQRWGDAAADAANARLLGMKKADLDSSQDLAIAVNEALAKAMEAGGPEGQTAREAVALHHQWLSHWGDYTPDMHKGLGDAYVADQRFAAYYEAVKPGAAAYLRDAIHAYYGSEEA